MKWFTDDQACLPGKGGDSLTSHWDHMPPPLVAWWVWSCWAPQLEGEEEAWRPGVSAPRPGREKEGCGSTWSLAAFLGQGSERKYMNRVAPGLAIWAEMLAARVGAWKEAPGPENWIPASCSYNKIGPLSFWGQPAWSGSPGHAWAECIRHSGSGDQVTERAGEGEQVSATLGLICSPPV